MGLSWEKVSAGCSQPQPATPGWCLAKQSLFSAQLCSVNQPLQGTSYSLGRQLVEKVLLYRVVQKKGTVLLSNSLAWPAVAGCSWAETFSQLSSISFAQPCTYNRCLKLRLSAFLRWAVQRGVNLFELSWEKVSARLQPATAGHARLVLSKQVEQIYTSLYMVQIGESKAVSCPWSTWDQKRGKFIV